MLSTRFQQKGYVEPVCKNFLHKQLMRSKTKLEFIHSYVRGPISVPFIHRSRYFHTCIDDYYTRMFWMYFFTLKSHVVERFDEFRKLIKNQYIRTVKCVRSHNEGEEMCINSPHPTHRNKPFLEH